MLRACSRQQWGNLAYLSCQHGRAEGQHPKQALAIECVKNRHVNKGSYRPTAELGHGPDAKEGMAHRVQANLRYLAADRGLAQKRGAGRDAKWSLT